MMGDGINSKDWPTLSDSTHTPATAARIEQDGNSKDWPTLSDSTSMPALTARKEHSKVRQNLLHNGEVMENPGTSTNGNATGAKRKKQTGKIKWSRVPIDLSYKDNRSERHYNESNRYSSNGRRSSSSESTHVAANGHENLKGRGFRGGRHGRGYSQFRSRRESSQTVDSRRCPRVHQEVGSVLDINGTECVSGSVYFSDDVNVKVMRQIEYYFSEKNLLKDTYLRFNMDEQGYAQLSLIANFPRIKNLTNDLQLILEAVKKSCYLEVCDDVKVRPVVDPLRWPLKEVIEETTGANAREPYVDVLAAQLYNLGLNPSIYPHISAPKSDLSGEIPWHFIPNDQNKNGTVYCPVNGIYPHVDSNGVSVTIGNLNIPNGQVCSSDQHNPSNSSSELAGQYIPNDYQNKSSPVFCSVHEIPSHIDSNSVDDGVGNSNFLNGQASSDQHISPLNSDLDSELVSQYIPNNYQSKSDITFCPVDDIHPQIDSNDVITTAGNLNIPNGHGCSSELRAVDEVNAYNCYFGQISNGVIMYNSGGRYYVAPSNDILANSSDNSTEDKSALHNKSPEPSR